MRLEPATSRASESALGVPVVPTVMTKLDMPRMPGYLIIRKRLLDALDLGVAGPLVVLSAPAGAGKTILAGSWVQTRCAQRPVAWLSFDADDNDASRLAADLLSALRSAGVIRRGGALDRLAAPFGARSDSFLAALVNGLAKLHSDFVLVLDDVHELTSPQATRMIDFLVRHAPAQCRLMLIGRTDPPIPIERLRVNGGLTELRVGDLAFDRDEAGALYRQLGLDLAEAEIDLLWQRTEGWAAALRLAGLSVQGHPEPRRFIEEFAGTDTAMADYLVSEVLAHVPAELRAFMLRTCLVDSVNPELADALTGLEAAALTLAALERSGAPVQRTGADGWYRYHPLFGELLRAHLHHSHPDELPLLHRRAARWYAEHGEVRHAIGHALAGEDWHEAGGLIEDNWLELFIAGASAAVRNPMAKLPVDVIAEHPRLAVAFAGSRLEDGDLENAELYLALARHAGKERHQGGQFELALAAVELLRARLRGDVSAAERHGEELTGFARTPAYDRWIRLRSFALSNLGATLLWAGHPREAANKLSEGLALAGEAQCDHIVFDCLAQLAIVELFAGRLTDADDSASKAIELSERFGWDDGSAPACAFLAAAGVAYWRGELQRAEGLVSRAVGAADTAELPVRLSSRVAQALTLAAAGPRSAARAALKLDAVRAAIADRVEAPPYLHVALEDAEAHVMLESGDLRGARRILTDARSRMPDNPVLAVREAELELRTGHPELVRTLVATAVEQEPSGSPETTVHPMTRLEACLLQALAEHIGGEHQPAAQMLERALAMAEQGGACGPFVSSGREMRDLLERHAESGTAHPALLEALLDGVDDGSREQAEPMLTEPLTERELRILRYLPTMLTNAEIGAETFVSLNTVKTHLRSIYRKLGARNRADAVERARTLSLLPRGISRPRVVYRA
jgi:LuxR family transcriptional regulator, maltose regulon positive regulatory protein